MISCNRKLCLFNIISFLFGIGLAVLLFQFSWSIARWNAKIHNVSLLEFYNRRVLDDFLVLEWKNRDKTRNPAQTDGANCWILPDIALHWAFERWVGNLQLLFCKQHSFHGFPSLILRCDIHPEDNHPVVPSLIQHHRHRLHVCRRGQWRILGETQMPFITKRETSFPLRQPQHAVVTQHFTISSGVDRKWFIEHIHFGLGECINTNKTFTPISLNRFSNVLPNPNLKKNAC